MSRALNACSHSYPSVHELLTWSLSQQPSITTFLSSSADYNRLPAAHVENSLLFVGASNVKIVCVCRRRRCHLLLRLLLIYLCQSFNMKCAGSFVCLHVDEVDGPLLFPLIIFQFCQVYLAVGDLPVFHLVYVSQ